MREPTRCDGGHPQLPCGPEVPCRRGETRQRTASGPVACSLALIGCLEVQSGWGFLPAYAVPSESLCMEASQDFKFLHSVKALNVALCVRALQSGVILPNSMELHFQCMAFSRLVKKFLGHS